MVGSLVAQESDEVRQILVISLQLAVGDDAVTLVNCLNAFNIGLRLRRGLIVLLPSFVYSSVYVIVRFAGTGRDHLQVPEVGMVRVEVQFLGCDVTGADAVAFRLPVGVADENPDDDGVEIE